MSKPCSHCIDPSCGGKKNCNCETCDKKSICPRISLKPTIRITKKCTQSCGHCCFECSPKSTEMMSLETAQNIDKFLRSNNITRAETMGGEFYQNPQWAEILDVISAGLDQVRLVTNGDWAADDATAIKVIDFLTSHPQFFIGLSKDKWHHNKGVDLAAERLTKANIPFRIPGKDEVTDESIVPVGRGEFQSTFYSFMGTFCGKPDRKYSFLIDEMGEIFKCGMGVWDYDNINHFLEGGFDDRFVEFNKKFYSIFIANCGSCERAFKHSLREEKKAQNKSLPIVKE